MKKRAVLLSVVLMSFCLNLSAQVIFRDVFDAVVSSPATNAGEYLVGTGLNLSPNDSVYGGSIVGFSTNHLWSGNSGLFKPQYMGLSYTNDLSREYSSKGGSVRLDLSSANDVARQVARQVGGVTAGSVWYFSALLRATTDSDGTAVLRFDDIDGLPPNHSPYMWGIGFGFQDGDIILITRSGSDSRITHTLVSNYVAGETYLVVVKVEVDTGVGSRYNDTVSVWVNPPGLLESTAGAPDFSVEINTITSNSTLLIDEFRIYTQNFGGGIIEFDEVNIGRWWENVVPSALGITYMYDGFSTDVGQYDTSSELNGQNPTVPGFIGAWRDASTTDWKPYGENLTYVADTFALKSAGGSAQVITPAIQNSSVSRTTTAISNSVVYISSLMSFDLNNASGDFAYAELRDADDATYFAGVQWGIFDNEFGIRCRSLGGVARTKYVVGDGSFVNGQVNLVVIKMEKDVDGWKDRVTVYLNPEDPRDEGGNTKGLEQLVGNLVGSTVLDELYIRTFNVNNGSFKLDEIRIGTTWSTVVPFNYIQPALPGTIILIQ